VNLPLSDAGWRAVQNGEPWAETASIEGERLLIYSAPVVVEGQVAQVVQVARALADQYQYLSTMGRNLLVGSGLATIIAFGAGWVLSGVVLRPVNRITQTAQAIGVERDLGRRVDYTGPNDEIGQLATTFNRMLTQLQAAYQQVERSLQQQRQFVADVSHELRTPLTTIRGNLALLRRKPAVGAEEETDILEDMAGESDRLIRLVNDLLALAHAESGRELQSETVWVKPLVEDVCRQARHLDPERTITCTDLVDVAVAGDQDALKQVLLILLDNALKYTGGAVAVSTAVVDERPTIEIRDSGPGIDPEVLPYVFERFYRGDEARSRPGIGLGLPIARALVEAQNGTISIESQIGHGSIITVTLPQAPVQREDSGAAQR
jgi:signal transduction histidine kinase